MNRRWFAPTNWIATQIVALLAVSSFVATGGAILIHLLLLPDFELSTEGLRPVMRIATVLRGIDLLPPEGRAQLIAAYDDPEFTAHLIDKVDIPRLEPGFAANRIRSLFARELPPGAEITAIDTERNNQVRLYAISRGGQGVVFDVAPREQEPMHIAIVSLMVFLLVSTAVLTIWAMRRLILPLKRFAAAVDRFGTEGHEAGNGGALREEGPVEIRRATSAFNRMQERIQRLIEDRTRMLAAISHDLRTPLTRLRLHIEELTMGVPRRRMLDEIALMDRLITSAISYIHEGGATESPEAADLPSLIATICDQFEDAGHAVTFVGPRHLTVRCLPLALGRALTNLIDNAVKFGSSVTVRLDTTCEADIAIDVEDDGPGIPDTEKALVLEPFYRADTARRTAGGFGLGLAIVATVARHHHGALTLHDGEPHGLRARLTIPRRGPPDEPPARRAVTSAAAPDRSPGLRHPKSG
jgi:signal transduction histidine kinase